MFPRSFCAERAALVLSARELLAMLKQFISILNRSSLEFERGKVRARGLVGIAAPIIIVGLLLLARH